jgi:hypothetical protein
MSDVTTQAAAEPTTTTTSAAAAVPVTQPVIDWESDANPYKRYKGYQTEFQKADAERKTLAGQLADIGLKLTTAEQEAKVKKAEAEKWSADFIALKTDADKTKAEFERLNIVATEFPGLLDLEKNGALPNKAGDDLRAALKAISDKIGVSASQQVNNLLDGASVTPPAANKPQTAEELKKAAIQMVQQGKPPAEIDKAWDAYYLVAPKEAK